MAFAQVFVGYFVPFAVVFAEDSVGSAVTFSEDSDDSAAVCAVDWQAFFVIWWFFYSLFSTLLIFNSKSKNAQASLRLFALARGESSSSLRHFVFALHPNSLF